MSSAPRQSTPRVNADDPGAMTADFISFGPFRLFAARRLIERTGIPLHLGGRALDILIALTEQAGKVVSKHDLMARIWPGVTVDEGSLRVHVASLRKALGDGEAGARYVTTLSGQGYCFVAPITRANAPEPSMAQRPMPDQLPARLARMVGRDQTVQEISGLLAAERFVTIVGPGGIGKTTVAVSVGHDLLAEFAGAVHFFDLGPINDPLLVPGSVASALGLPVQSSDPTPGLIALLRNKRMLLVLDSCEHVIETAAALAERIFQDAPGVHLLATSRESLRVEGEHVHRLLPLGSPPDDAGLTAAQALGFPAVQLFVERAIASGRRFALNDADAPMVAEICRRLDGIALAIQLAAGRADAYGIEQTLLLLNDRFKLLWEGRRTALPRHQTLSATLDWSYNLLSESERLVLRGLSVFAGIFTLEAACSVAADTDVDETKVVTALVGLAAKSLVTVSAGDTTTRYRLLDTTRAYAAGKLAGIGEVDAIKRRHAIYYREFLERSETGLLASTSDSNLRSELLGNVRAALEWSFSSRNDVGMGTALAAAAAPLFSELSLLTECRRLTERALAALDHRDRGTRREMELQASLGASLMLTEGNRQEAHAALIKALEIAEALDDPYFQMRLLRGLHIFLLRIGDFRSAATLARRNETLAERTGDPIGIAMANWILGVSNYFIGNQLAAEANCEASLLQPTVSRIHAVHFGFDRHTSARIRCALAAIRWLRGYPDQAAQIAQQTIGEEATREHPATFCTCLIFSGFMFLRIGNLSVAENTIERLIAHADKHSLGPFRTIGLGLRGTLSIHRGEAEAGIELLRPALDTLHADRYELHNPTFLGTLAEGLAMTGHRDAALIAVDDAIARVESNGQAFNLPELLRIKGAILMSAPQADLPKADETFLRSIEIARQQHALAWELRTATDMARLRLAQNRHDDAFAVLAPVYDRFTEGLESFDLKAARQLLDQLRSPRRPLTAGTTGGRRGGPSGF
jgi:predicted ATPase/DNA-binding winged helix-turn-helix (wHTH) protein